MVQYVQHAMNLKPAQLMKLAKGRKIRVKHADLTGEIPIFLTKQQAKKIQTRHSKGLGMDMMFDQTQLNHNIKFGGSFWSRFKNFLSQAASKINEEFVQPVIRGLRPKAEEARDRLVNRTVGAVGDLAERGLRRVGAGTKKGVMPPGLARYHAERKAMKMQTGDGFFSDLARGAAAYGVRQGGPALTNLIADKIEGKGLRGNFLFGRGMMKKKAPTKNGGFIPGLSSVFGGAIPGEMDVNNVYSEMPKMRRRKAGGSFRLNAR